MNLKFTNIVKHYGNKRVLDELSFKVSAASCVALVGNNGCGKTTTIEVMCNLLEYDEGEYAIDGTKVTPQYISFKKNVGMLLSKPYYIESFSVDKYWEFVGKYQKVDKDDISSRIEDLHQLLNTESERNKTIRKLSSGNKIKTSIGATLIHNPKVLILDEPFVNLDIKTTRSILEVLKRFKGKKTIYITSHDLDTVANLCDEFLIMDQGRILMNLRKSDFSTVEELKNEVKSYLVQDQKVQDIDWLN